MQIKKNITPKIFLLLVFTDFLETATQYFFKQTASLQSTFEIVNLHDIFIFAKTALFTPYIWLGFLSVIITFIIWSTVLSRIDLSVAVPVCSFSYILVPLTSIFMLHETIPALRWAGIIMILAGVIFVSKSSSDKEEEKTDAA